jgi:hypothetical protein
MYSKLKVGDRVKFIKKNDYEMYHINPDKFVVLTDLEGYIVKERNDYVDIELDYDSIKSTKKLNYIYDINKSFIVKSIHKKTLVKI